MALTQVPQQMIAGGPAFSAYQSTLQSVANNTATKVQLQSESFDTNSNFDNATNYRFLPTVAGYYQLTFAVGFSVTPGALSSLDMMLYFNGAQAKLFRQPVPASTANPIISATQLVYFNGTTDYAELWISHAFGSATNTNAANDRTYFQGALVRPA